MDSLGRPQRAVVPRRRQHRVRQLPRRHAAGLDLRRGHAAHTPADVALDRRRRRALVALGPDARLRLGGLPRLRRRRLQPAPRARPTRRGRARRASSTTCCTATGTSGTTARAAISSSCPRPAGRRATCWRARTTTRRCRPSAAPADYAWSPDEQRAGLHHQGRPRPGVDHQQRHLHRAGDRRRAGERDRGHAGRRVGTPSYSPDGRYLSFLSQERAGFESDRVRLMVKDRQTGQVREVTARLRPLDRRVRLGARRRPASSPSPRSTSATDLLHIVFATGDVHHILTDRDAGAAHRRGRARRARRWRS